MTIETKLIMEKKINIAELLKDCPKGMELDCSVYDNVQFDIVQNFNAFPIKINTPEGRISLSKYGCYSLNPQCKCIIFPKGKTTWEGFVPPYQFKDGDVISDSLGTCIFKGEGVREGTVNYYCGISNGYFSVNDDKCRPNGHYGDIVDFRLATEEEKQKLFQAIKDNGYKWNAETKTLEMIYIEQEDLIEDCLCEIRKNIYGKAGIVHYILLKLLERCTKAEYKKIVESYAVK